MALLAGGMMMLCTPVARATVRYYWTGATPNGHWSVGANWVGGGAPNGGDERIVFPQNVLRKNATNDLPAGTLFESIWIEGVNYEIHGNAVRISNLTMEVAFFGGTSIFGPEIRASGDLTIQMNSANTHLIASGDIILSGDILTVASGFGGAGDVTLSGAISGNGSLYKRNLGGLTLSGFSPNTFTGRTTLIYGTVRLNKASLLPPGPLIAVPGNLDTASTVVLERDDQIASNADVESYGTLDLNGHHQTIRSLTMLGGDVATGTGVLTLGGNVTASGDSTISGRLSLGSGTRRFNVASNATLQIPAVISAGVGVLDAGVTKADEGTLRLSGANTYFGPTTILGGTLTAANDDALGHDSSGTTVRNGKLTLSNADIANEALSIDPDATMACQGASSWRGNINLDGIAFFSAGTGDVLRVTGPISGPGSLRKTGVGILRLGGTAPNIFEGNAQVNAGTLELQKPAGVIAIPNRLVVGLGGTPDSDVVRLLASQQIADDALVDLSSSGLLDLNTFSETVRAVFGSGNVALGSGSTLTVTNETGAHTFSGTISGAGNLIKQGSSKWTLEGTNTCSGTTYLRGGTLLVNGPLASSTLHVERGTLGGTGTVQTVMVSGPGTVSPGDPLGILRVDQDLLFLDGVLHIEINSTVVESGYDRLRVGGNVTIGSAALSVAMGFQPPFNTNFNILNKVGAGAISGTFASLPEGGYIGAGGFAFQISYQGGNGNDVTLSRVPVPASRITSIRNETSSATIRGAGLAGIIYTLQGAADLTPPIPWTDLGSGTGDASGLYQFIDLDVANYPRRFYRVRSP